MADKLKEELQEHVNAELEQLSNVRREEKLKRNEIATREEQFYDAISEYNTRVQTELDTAHAARMHSLEESLIRIREAKNAEDVKAVLHGLKIENL